MRNQLTALIALVTVVALGLTAGAMLAEAAVLVPFWQSVPAEEFFDWYSKNAKILVDFYSPLEITSTVLAVVTAFLYVSQGRPGSRFWVSSAVLSILVIVCFFVYFKDANFAFANRAIPYEDVPGELVIWGTWQWVRVGLGATAFIAAIVAVSTWLRR